MRQKAGTSEHINIYCDESSHLEQDKHPVMVLGALWCPREKTREIANRIREIKSTHGIAAHAELKWGKVSPSNLSMFLDLTDYIFDDDDVHIRILVADKTNLNHKGFGRTHDEWYYKMYFLLLSRQLKPSASHYIYVDIKDTRSIDKVRKLEEILRTAKYDFDSRIIQQIQHVRSHEVEQVQLSDLVIGAVNYVVRGQATSPAKSAVAERIRERSGYDLRASTLPSELKFNLFHWQGRATE